MGHLNLSSKYKELITLTNEELNKYILHYVKSDKTKSAKMLSGAWGIGKSYYIQNELVPFLAKESNGAYSCIIVSLYGLNDVTEISKYIFFEASFSKLINTSKKKQVGYLTTKTVIKGITDLIGVNLSLSEKDLNRLFSLIDLSGKLIILEDLERSGISVNQVLGYVNNLVEHDNIRVLLVANEEEIIKYQNSEPDKNGIVFRTPDETTRIYLETKEKTISDTVYYCGDIRNTIKSIILSFENEKLNPFSEDNALQDIKAIMGMINNYNLRTFIFACQKTIDIFELTKLETYDLRKQVFYGIIAFSYKIKQNHYPSWDGDTLFSMNLGTRNYPLFRFCYDYIRFHEMNINLIMPSFEAYKQMLLYDKNTARTDSDLNIIYSFYLYPEKDVLSALQRIENRLNDALDIPFYEYSKICYYLIKCNTVLEFDYSLCQERMKHNLMTQGRSFDPEMLKWHLGAFDNDEEKEKYESLTDSLLAMFTLEQDYGPFNYEPAEIHDYYNYVIKNESKVVYGHRFISKFDVQKLLDMIYQSTPCQIDEFRGILLAIYRHATKAQFIEDDCIFMEELKHAIKERIAHEGPIDRIKKLQIQYLLDNLEDFINQLS